MPSRSIYKDVLTDSEVIYKAYVRLLKSLHWKVSLLGIRVSLSIHARGGDIFMNINILKSFNRKVSRLVVGVSFIILSAKGGG